MLQSLGFQDMGTERHHSCEWAHPCCGLTNRKCLAYFSMFYLERKDVFVKAQGTAQAVVKCTDAYAGPRGMASVQGVGLFRQQRQ